MKEYIGKDEIIEHFDKRVRYTVGEDSSKERYRYMQWLTDYNSIISIPTVKAIPLDKVEKIRAEIKGLSPIPTAEDVVDGNAVKDAIWETLIEVDKIIDKAIKEAADDA